MIRVMPAKTHASMAKHELPGGPMRKMISLKNQLILIVEGKLMI